MYEHPSLTITAMLEEQQMLNRAVERRRAILERLETQGVPRVSWFDRIRAALRGGSATAPERGTTSAVAAPAAEATVSAGAATGSAERAGRRRDAATAVSGRPAAVDATAARSAGSAGDPGVSSTAVPIDGTLADAGILVLPVR